MLRWFGNCLGVVWALFRRCLGVRLGIVLGLVWKIIRMCLKRVWEWSGTSWNYFRVAWELFGSGPGIVGNCSKIVQKLIGAGLVVTWKLFGNSSGRVLNFFRNYLGICLGIAWG